MENRHNRDDLKQMQCLSLENKILMTKQRIRDWYENWHRFEIVNEKTGHIRYVAVDVRDKGWDYEPKLRNNEYVKAEYPGAVYVSFSGGKDSTVLKHIVDTMYNDVPSLFINTGLEYPEIQKFAQSFDNVITVRPKMKFTDTIGKYGYPVISKNVSHNVAIARNNPDGNVAKNIFNPEKTGKYALYRYDYLRYVDFNMSDKCCEHNKKNPSREYAKENGRVSILGTMAEESVMRLDAWVHEGCNAWDAKYPHSAPLSFWREQDIYEYIIKYDLPICSVYGEIIGIMDDCEYDQGTLKYLIDMNGIPENMKFKTTGASRTGCIYCGFGAHLEKEPNRFQMLKETHPKQYNYCINGGSFDEDGLWKPDKNGLGLGYVLDTIGVNYK